MLYLLWAIVNIGLFIWFIVICFNATKLVRQKMGTLASIVLALGLLSFIGQYNSDKDNLKPGTNQTKSWEYVSSDSLDKSSMPRLR